MEVMKRMQYIQLFEDLFDGVPYGFPERLSKMSAEEFRQLFEKVFSRMLKNGNLDMLMDYTHHIYLHVNDIGSAFEIFVNYSARRGMSGVIMVFSRFELNKNNLGVEYLIKYEESGRLKPVEYYLESGFEDGVYVLTEDVTTVKSIEDLVRLVDTYMVYFKTHEKEFDFEHRMNMRKTEYYKKHGYFHDNGFEYYRDK